MICYKTKMIIFLFIFMIIKYIQNAQNETNFVCNSGQIVNIYKVCDGIADCFDKSDETIHFCRRIMCPMGKFHCFSGGCIAVNLKCDGQKHCADGSDEGQCKTSIHGCSVTEFRCSTGECISMKKLCDGNNDCKESSDEGDICKKISCPPFTHRCNVGSCIFLNQRCDGHRDCIDGSDELEILCSALNCTGKNCHDNAKPQVFCSPISSRRVNVNCEIPKGRHKGLISCNLPLPPGTIVRYECKPYYVPSNPADKNNKEIICQLDGTWNRDVLHCIPDCGIEVPNVALLIIKGWIPEQKQIPWHAVLFTLEEGHWIFTCGGTLISEKIVITAAHCTWNTPKELLQVGLGKQYSDYYKLEDYAQIENIAKIITPPTYQDLEGNYGSDIAILVLRRDAKFSAAIKPACIDWNLDDINEDLTDNNLGMIAGMGITENHTFSLKLAAVYLPVVNNTDCMQNQNKDFKKYITFTSFCAGWRNGTGVCNGDSGGGLVFSSIKNSKKFTIQGIVSVSPRRFGTSFCDPNYYTVFTKFGIFIKWIYHNLQNIEYVNNKIFQNNVIL